MRDAQAKFVKRMSFMFVRDLEWNGILCIPNTFYLYFEVATTTNTPDSCRMRMYQKMFSLRFLQGLLFSQTISILPFIISI